MILSFFFSFQDAPSAGPVGDCLGQVAVSGLNMQDATPLSSSLDLLRLINLGDTALSLVVLIIIILLLLGDGLGRHYLGQTLQSGGLEPCGQAG